MLALLQSLSAANAEQALELLGIQTPSPSSRQNVPTAAKPEASATAANAAAAAAAGAQSSGGADVGTTIDPLWGVRA